MLTPSSSSDAATSARPLRDVFGYKPEWAVPSAADRDTIVTLMRATEPRGGSASKSATASG